MRLFYASRIVFALLSYSLVASSELMAQETEATPLFRFVDPTTMDLNPKQKSLLDKLGQEETVEEITIVKLEPDALRQPVVNLNFAANESLEATKTLFREQPGRGFTWSGKVKDMPLTAHFSINDSNGNGSFWAGKYSYNLRPLGNGMHALIKRDPAKVNAKEEPPAFKKIEEEANKKEPPARKSTAEAPASHTVTILVAYTDAVEGRHNSIADFVDSVIDVTNNCYQESRVPIALKLVGLEKVAYVESNDIERDVNRLKGQNDGHMDNLHQVRDQRKADLVVLLIEHADAYGMAAAILANPETGFAVVDDEVADWYFTFAHELGHLFGCRHDPGADPSTTPFPYGHCYCNHAKQWRTIMAYDCTGQSQRIGIFSSPLLTYPNPHGDPAGTASVHDNCRVLRETAATIAGFR